nr:copia protein [Tanacetum cinerariifolium]
MVRNKERLVAQCYTQEERIDYDEVFAVAARIKAIRLFLACASFKDFVAYQMDVKSAFLYGKIEVEVYVCQPLGFEDPEFLDRVYKKEMCTEFEKMMHKKFQMSFIGELTFFLGLQVKQKDDWIFISQDKYVNVILKKFGFSIMKTASTPMETSKPLMKDENAKDDSPIDLEAYTDSDYAGASLDKKFTTGDYQFLRSRMISWQCKKQTIVANSNTKAEYVAVANCCRQIINFLSDNPIKYALTVNPTIYTSYIEQFWATAMAKNINREAHIHANVDGKKKQKPRKPKRQNTQENQPSDHTDEALNVENVPIQSNDLPLSRVNTLGSGENSLKLKDLMEICTNLQQRVIKLENTKAVQAQEISNVLNDEEVVVETVVTDATTNVVSINDITLTQALVEIKTSKPKKAFDKTMSWIKSFVPMESKVVKDKVVLIQESSSKRAGDKLDQGRSKKQKVEDDKDQEELKRCLEIIPDDGDDVTIDATPLSIKTLILITRIYKL